MPTVAPTAIPTVNLSGKVQNSSGTPVAGVFIKLQGTVAAQSSETGDFSVGLPDTGSGITGIEISPYLAGYKYEPKRYAGTFATLRETTLNFVATAVLRPIFSCLEETSEGKFAVFGVESNSSEEVTVGPGERNFLDGASQGEESPTSFPAGPGLSPPT